ncbi:SPFH domain-containing protein [Lacisediminihabitans sp. FW035]
MPFNLNPLVAIIAAVIVVFLIVLIYAKSIYKNAGPDEAILITGKRSKVKTVDGVATEESGIRIVVGSGVFITPFFQKAFKISLRSRAIELAAVAQDARGITLTVEAVAIVKVGDTHSAILAAGQRFIGNDKNIDGFALEVLSGSLRSSIGGTDVQTIIQKRDELGAAVLSTARESLLSQGLDVDSFEIKGISDDNDYIHNMGRAEQASVLKAAEVAEAQAGQASQEASIAAEQAVAIAQNTLALKRAALQLDTDKATAEAAGAKPLAEAKTQQNIVHEQEVTAQAAAKLRTAQLASEVNAVADADAYRVKIAANAAAEARVIAATAERDSRVANAEAIRAEGQATADAILAKGQAEAEATKLAAEAVAQKSEALIQLRLVEMLPQIAHELAAPMGNIDQLTVVSTDGASQLTKNVAGGFTEIDAVLKSTTGIDLRGLLGSFAGGAVAGAAAGASRSAASADAPITERAVAVERIAAQRVPVDLATGEPVRTEPAADED